MKKTDWKLAAVLAILAVWGSGCEKERDGSSGYDDGYHSGAGESAPLIGAGSYADSDGSTIRAYTGANACTEDYIERANLVIDSAKAVMAHYNADARTLKSETTEAVYAWVDSVRKLDQSCDQFLARYRGQDCTAIATSNYSIVRSNSAKLESGCSQVKDVLNRIDSNLNRSISMQAEAIREDIGFETILAVPRPTDENVEFLPGGSTGDVDYPSR